MGQAQKRADDMVQEFEQWMDKRVKELLNEKEVREVSPPSRTPVQAKEIQEALTPLILDEMSEVVLEFLLKNDYQKQKQEQTALVEGYLQKDQEFQEEMKNLEKHARKLAIIVLKEIIKYFDKKGDVHTEALKKEMLARTS